MEEKRGASQDEPTTFQLPPPRELSRFSTTYSFYEFIDQELKEEEERDMLILRVRENIIGSLVEELYNRYMDRQVIPFTVRCFLQSLKRVMNWYFFPRDPEDTALDWERDAPVQPIPVDNWASYCVPAGSYPPQVKFDFKAPFEEVEEEEVGGEHEEEEVGGEDFDFERFDMYELLNEELGGEALTAVSVHSTSLPNLSSGSLSDAAVSPVRKPEETSPRESKGSKARKTHFLDTQSLPKIKREINQWISPRNFPPVRVNAGLNILPGEKFSGKTCGRKHQAQKNIFIRPPKPTLLSDKGSVFLNSFRLVVKKKMQGAIGASNECTDTFNPIPNTFLSIVLEERYRACGKRH